MITIKNGAHTLSVTRGAYNAFYKSQGWNVEGASPHPTMERAGPTHEKSRKNELASMSVSNMSTEELKEAAELFGVEIEGKSKSDVKRELTDKMMGD